MSTEVRPCLSVVIPCYNEEATIQSLINLVLNSPWVAEIIVVDDGSKDRSREILATVNDSKVRVVLHDVNKGKGAALRTGFQHATSEFVIVQDADLEYDPSEYPLVLEPLLDDRADVVFGSRFMGGNAHRVLFFWHTIGNRFLTFLSNMFSNLNLTDMETCYKLFNTKMLQSLKLKEKRFGFEPEVTAKISRVTKVRIYEVGISYYGRTYDEGKKINWKDGFRAIYCIFKYGFLKL